MNARCRVWVIEGRGGADTSGDTKPANSVNPPRSPKLRLILPYPNRQFVYCFSVLAFSVLDIIFRLKS